MMMRTALRATALLSLSPPPRNRGLPRLRILISRKSGRPDLRWGRAREGGGHERRLLGLPLSLTLSHKGRGKSKSMPRGVRSLLLANVLPPLTPAVAIKRSLLSLSPPPLWGRVREGGTTRAGACGLPLSPTLPHKRGGRSKSAPRDVRSLLLAAALPVSSAATAFAQVRDNVISAPGQLADFPVSGHLVR